MGIVEECLGVGKSLLAHLLTEKVIVLGRGEGATVHGVLVPKTHEWKDTTAAIDERESRIYKLAELRAAGPRRIEDAQLAETLDGFCAIVNRHKNQCTALSATIADGGGLTPKLLAVIDYHLPSDGSDLPNARWKKHTVEYRFPLSHSLRLWKDAGRWMDKKELVAFVERRFMDLADPDEIGAPPPALADVFRRLVKSKPTSKEHRASMGLADVFGSPVDLLRGAREMGACTTEKLSEVVDEFGQVAVSYEKQSVLQRAVASRFYILEVPVFEGDSAFGLVPIRLDLAIEDGRIRFRFELIGLDQVVQAAFAAACVTAEHLTGLPAYRATL